MPADLRFLQKVDLNLLKVFKAVHDLGQTTAAADHLGLTQPAVSQGLRRLRELVGDPLFVPGNGRMQPTVRANELSGPVSEALAGIQRALEREPQFDPATARRRFRISMLDYGIMVFATSLAKEISSRAPGITIDIDHVPTDSAARLLIADQIDLATGPFSGTASVLQSAPLYSDSYAVIARKGHEALGGGINPERLSDLGHVDVTFDTTTGGGIDAALARFGIRRKKMMQVPMFSGACFVVGSSDLVAIVPRRLAQINAGTCGLDVHDLPDGFPRLQINALTHRRNSADPGMQWLTSVLLEAGNRGPLAAPIEKFGRDAKRRPERNKPISLNNNASARGGHND